MSFFILGGRFGEVWGFGRFFVILETGEGEGGRGCI